MYGFFHVERQPSGGVALSVRDKEGLMWEQIGDFPTSEEAKAHAESLLPGLLELAEKMKLGCALGGE